MNHVDLSGGMPTSLPDARWRVPVHPQAVTARRLIEQAGRQWVRCPHCHLQDVAVTVHDHLRSEHSATHVEVMRWLDLTDPDLFALAIHHLAALPCDVGGAQSPRGHGTPALSGAPR